MGSSGTGTFSDYSGTPKGDGGSGGASGEDKCSRPFECELEEVARCDYYKNNNAVPPVSEAITITFATRLIATASGGRVGYLPTRYNYLAGCMKDGWRYRASVVSTTEQPFPRVSVEVTAER